MSVPHIHIELWSELHSFVAQTGALCSHESEAGRSLGGPLSYLVAPGEKSASSVPACLAPSRIETGVWKLRKKALDSDRYDRINNPILG